MSLNETLYRAYDRLRSLEMAIGEPPGNFIRLLEILFAPKCVTNFIYSLQACCASDKFLTSSYPVLPVDTVIILGK